MQRSKRLLVSGTIMLLAGLAAVTAAIAVEAPAPAQVVSGNWQHHKVTFNYYGITTLYSCDGLETDVKAILLHFGARKDAKVSAQGCPHGPEVPSHNAFVNTDFYTLSPQAAAGADKGVPSYWAAVELNAHRPYFMGHGQCELIDDMKDLVTKNFSFRDLDYRANCVPHEINLNDFSVKAQVLQAVPATVARAPSGA
ncbi:MAG TPA: hypothetical protein VHW71_08245 [Steroidobacteraceae bacterium]|jgi:hypothetical protein|nr:hypothetical protein [Steroidobacteraceae bacterium]